MCVSDPCRSILNADGCGSFQIEMSRKSIKRIKLESDGLKLQSSSPLEELTSRPSSPEKGVRTLQSNAPLVNTDDFLITRVLLIYFHL